MGEGAAEAPETIRCDKGPEFSSRPFLGWCQEWRSGLLPTSHAERARGELERAAGDECLNANWFATLADARSKIEAWRQDCNEQRPHSSLG